MAAEHAPHVCNYVKIGRFRKLKKMLIFIRRQNKRYNTIKKRKRTGNKQIIIRLM